MRMCARRKSNYGQVRLAFGGPIHPRRSKTWLWPWQMLGCSVSSRPMIVGAPHSLQTQLATVGATLTPLFADAATAERGQAGGQAVTRAALLLRGRSLLLVAHGRLALRRVVLSRGRAVSLKIDVSVGARACSQLKPQFLSVNQAIERTLGDGKSRESRSVAKPELLRHSPEASEFDVAITLSDRSGGGRLT